MKYKNILLMYKALKPSARHVSRLKEIGSDFEVIVADSEKMAIEAARDAEIVFGRRYLRQSLPYANNLRWVQITARGIDSLPLRQLMEKKVLVTNTTAFAGTVARHAQLLAWALVRRLPEFFYFQTRREWMNNTEMLPAPKTALILGFGHIGQALARLLQKDGIEVCGVKRCWDNMAEGLCSKMFGANEWRQILPQVDLCFLALPLTRHTKGMFDEAALQTLPKHAVVINVGRGETLNITAALKLLKKGRLGGMGLDVFSPEPPSWWDPAWKARNVIITPHVAAHSAERSGIIEEYFEFQLKRYLEGGVMQNIVDCTKVAGQSEAR